MSNRGNPAKDDRSRSHVNVPPLLECSPLSVAEVLFRTAPENRNRQNRTVKFGSVLFSPNNSWSCSVLGSDIWEDIQNRVQTGSNRTEYI